MYNLVVDIFSERKASRASSGVAMTGYRLKVENTFSKIEKWRFAILNVVIIIPVVGTGANRTAAGTL